MNISFHGADRNVTGSCHLLECAGKRILIDCGLYQGRREIKEENQKPFGFDPASIDYLLLTHAHLDHCGRIPLLVKQGFTGEIISTAASFELARLILLDSAGLQEEEARYQQRRAKRGKKHNKELFEPLYTILDALNSFEFFGRRSQYKQRITLAKGIHATFLDAGHILGSASIFFELEEKGKKHRIVFSGDIGYSNRVILRDPDPVPEVDTVVMETTYGDRLHKALVPSIEELYEAIETTLDRGGNIVIPTFALERAQEILYYLREGIEKKLLRHYMSVFLDSPMAISATEIFKHHPECFDEEALQILNNRDPFGLPGLKFTRETAESMAINHIKGGAVIMAGSGMCTGGRVRHHLKHNLENKRNTVIFVGYAVKGTLARKIIDGAKRVKIYGDEIAVNAEIYTIGGFSAHADATELLAWHKRAGSPARTILVHGDKDVMKVFAGKLKNTKVMMPSLHEIIEL